MLCELFRFTGAFKPCDISYFFLRFPVESGDITASIANAQGIVISKVVEVSSYWGQFDLMTVPDGFFSFYSGPFTIQFRDENNAIIPFIFETETYLKALFDVAKFNSTGLDYLNIFNNDLPPELP